MISFHQIARKIREYDAWLRKSRGRMCIYKVLCRCVETLTILEEIPVPLQVKFSMLGYKTMSLFFPTVHNESNIMEELI